MRLAQRQDTEVRNVPFVISGSRRRRTGILGAFVGLGLLTAGPAQAATTAANPLKCVAQPALAHPFTAFGDSGTYTLLNGGDMESSLAGWTLSGGAAIVDGNAPFAVGATSDHRSLSLPSGATVITAPVCIDQTYPWFRLFVRNTGAKLAALNVQVLYLDTKGKLVSKASGSHVSAPGIWSLSDTLEIKLKFDVTVAAGAAPVAFRFTAATGTSWTLDDVNGDPRARG
jgi:hypothetical protein